MRASVFTGTPRNTVDSPSLQLSFILIIFFVIAPVLAQEKIKWGEVPRADLEMKTFPADSNATAVILADYGSVEFVGSDFTMVFRRHRRIKILSEAGYDWGDLSVQYYAKDRLQRLSDVEGLTIKFDAKGAVQKQKLDKASIFDENVDGSWRRLRFSMPGLSPGAVIEYRYTVHSRNGTFLHDWEFQSSEPTRWSEFSADIPQILQFVVLRQNTLQFAVEETETHPIPPSQLNSAYTLKVVSSRWAMRDVPALRREPYMTTVDNYVARLRFQLASVNWPGEMPIKVMQNWEKLAEDLMLSENFGGQLNGHGDLRKQAQTLTTGLTDPEQKLRVIYDYVRSTMTWNDDLGIYTDVNLDKAWQARKAGGPEIALMLTSMLRAAGIDAHPVLISTRANGDVVDIYSILSQFNHVLSYAKIGAKEFLLDATDPLCPYTLLPEHALNQMGWLVDKKSPRWVKINSSGVYSNQTLVQAKLDADGKLAGQFEASDAGYSGVRDRHTLRKKKEDEYIRDGWLKGLAGAQLDSFKITDKDSTHKPLLTRAHFRSPDHAQVAGDNIYFNPMFFGRLEKNPFTLPERNFPVDYAYGQKLNYVLTLTLPPGFAAQEIPKNLTLNLPKDTGQYRRLIMVEGNTLQMNSQFIIRKPRFEPYEYKALREFYDRVVAAHAEQVVLKRGTATAPK